MSEPTQTEAVNEPAPDAHDPPPPGTPWRGIWVTVLGTLVCLGIAMLIEPVRSSLLHAVQGDTDAVRADLDRLGAWAPVIVFALTQIHVVIWFPAEIINAAAGFAFGFWPALALVHTGWMLSAILGYLLGKRGARPLIDLLVGEERLLSVERLVERGGWFFLLCCRLIPVIPFAFFNMAGGAARVPLWRFTWTTAVGYLPQTAIFVYVGSRLTDLSLTDPLILGALALLIVLLGFARFAWPLLTKVEEIEEDVLGLEPNVPGARDGDGAQERAQERSGGAS